MFTSVAALLKDWKLLDLPKLLDICAVYDHDNHELTSQLVTLTLFLGGSFQNTYVFEVFFCVFEVAIFEKLFETCGCG